MFLNNSLDSWNNVEVDSYAISNAIIELNNIFHWPDHWVLFEKLSFRDIAIGLESSTNGKNKISSENSLVTEFTPLIRSLIYTEKNNGLQVECREILELTWDQFEDCSLRMALWLQSLKNECLSL